MKKLRILIIEDSKEDYILLSRSLERAGLNFEPHRVASLDELGAAIAQDWDLALSDYHLPGFTGLEVLETLRRFSKNIPVIIISGAVAEEDAADLMRVGARDFVKKDNHGRLVPAILREIEESQERRGRQSAELALADSQELTNRILQSLPDSVYLIDRKGDFTSEALGSSQGLSRRHGAPLAGQSFLSLWTKPNEARAAVQALEQARAGGSGKFIGSLSGPLHDSTNVAEGQTSWWHVVVSPIRSSAQAPERFLVVAREISVEVRNQEELARRAAELKVALERAESANRMKTSFLANMSHEIRTPIGAMMGFADLLVDPATAEAEKSDLHDVIRRNGETLLRLLNEILDLSKIEAGHLEIEMTNFPLRVVVDDLLHDIKIRAEEKGLALSTEFDLKLPISVHTDAIRLKQILSNLLFNAVKFTEQGAIHLTVDSFVARSQNYLRFRIKDTGVGIQAEEHAGLFAAFSQGDNSFSRRYGGIGLGLALARRLARALGGDVILLSSEPGKGSEFLATVANGIVAGSGLVIAESTKKTSVAGAQGVAAAAKPIEGFRILVADDSVDNQHLIKRALTNRGAVVEVACNGVEAMRLALEGDHHLILMDLQMPELDGMAATRELRGRGFSKPIIALTAHAMKENRDECLAMGFTNYICKPINFSELTEVLLKTCPPAGLSMPKSASI